MDKYIGKLLDGRYEILELIGTGGMANVYKARCRLLNRYVAIKILKDEFAQDEEFRRRFHNESQAVAMLAHHNIVSIFDVSKTDELEYIVMELVDGISLKEYLKQHGSLNWKDALFFAAQICAALNHAHSRGIIHQDIKPHNILVLKNGEVKVTDFGIAKINAGQDTRVVQEAIGSVHYMAPEQAKGGRIDPRTDIYSLGVVMYEMLTGRLPFEGDNPLSIVMQHLSALPLLPSEIQSGVPKAMDDIVMKAMSPDPDRRYGSAEELYRDLIALKNDPNMVLGYTLEDTGRVGDPTQPVTDQTMRFYAGDAAKGRPAQPFQPSEEGEDSSRRGGKRGSSKKTGKKKDDDNAMRVPMLAMVLVLVVFIIGAVFLIRSLLSSSATEMIEIPNFVGQQLEEVEENEEYDQYVFQETDQRIFDDTVEPGTILKQTPDAGEKRAKTSDPITITVTLSTNEEAEEEGIEVPDLTNESYQLALVELAKLDIESTVVYEKSDEVDNGHVIRTTPQAGEMLLPGEKLVLVVSEGEEIELEKVPYLVGMTQEEAKSALEKVGLKLGTVTQVESDEEEGTVLTQSIPKNVEVRVGSSVDIEVAKAKPAQVDPPPEEDTEGSATLNVALPQTVSQAHVVVKIGGTVVYDAIHETTQGSVDIPLTGEKGSTLVTVTVDDNTYEQVVEFQ